MANVELLYFDQVDQRGSSNLSAKQSLIEGGCGGGEPPHPSGGQDSEPWTETLKAEEETAFRCKHDEDERLSVDYGFIIAVTCLVTGISLVAITYTVPRDVRVDPDSVSAREMERLERDRARVGAHLDRCVIAGLCLLTLGGVLLSTLLMVSMWKGEMMRRRALADYKHAARLYGSLSLRTGSSQTLESCSQLSAEDDDLELLS
ncbi:hypothetical protein OJAV_G00110330 [Oryzias javanicus]|uniref:Transmembrane protein 74 n=1 Tax=Oryzias javanicus TaxID=123683 RepID=A0A437CW72_ORYJA|nr:hypothetical protein OJAV_G00110330 [Oryzias javanicus]